MFYDVEGRGAVIESLLRAIEQRRARSLVVFPEGLAINYLSGVDNPLAFHTFTPIEAAAPEMERAILRQMEERKPELVAIVTRDVREFGYQGFGVDYHRERRRLPAGGLRAGGAVALATVRGDPFGVPVRQNAPPMAYNTLLVELDDGVLTVTLNRPEVHNAFNDELIVEAIDLFSNIDADAARVVVLKGTGKNFCAGADLNWMSRMVSYTRDENIRDSSLLAKMYALINECPLPVVGRIQGAAIGGGVGLVAVCDVAIAHDDVAVRVVRGEARDPAGGDLAVRDREDRRDARARAVPHRRALRRRARAAHRARPSRRRERSASSTPRSTRPSRSSRPRAPRPCASARS